MGMITDFYTENEKKIDEIIVAEKKHIIHSLLLINIDNLYKINEELGIEEADSVLKMVGEEIKNFFKGTDVVAQINLGEYAVLIQNPKSINDIEKICDRMLKHIKALSFDNISISCSVGISVYPFHGKNYESLRTNAYQALIRAKANGKNCYRVYESALTKAKFSNYLFEGDYDDFDYRILDENAWDKYFMDVSLQLFHYDSNIYACLNSLLEIFSLYHGFNRAFIVTNIEHDLYDKKMMSFSMPGYELAQGEFLDVIRNDLINRLYDEKGKYGIVRRDMPAADIEIMNYMDDTKTNELLYFGVMSEGEFVGGIVFENVDGDYSKVGASQMMSISTQLDAILNYALLSKNFRGSKELFSKIEMFEGMEACVYIIDQNSHTVEYMNKKAIDACGMDFAGKKCFDILQENDKPCADCPMAYMDVNDLKANCRKECLNHSTCKWSTNLYSWVSARDNKGKVLLISIDSENVFEALKE